MIMSAEVEVQEIAPVSLLAAIELTLDSARVFLPEYPGVCPGACRPGAAQ